MWEWSIEHRFELGCSTCQSGVSVGLGVVNMYGFVLRGELAGSSHA